MPMIRKKINYTGLAPLLSRDAAARDSGRRLSCDATVVFSNEDNNLEVWQLPPLAGMLLRLCDGKRTVAEITREFGLLDLELNDIPPEKACLFGLMQLIEDGVIGLSSQFTFPPKASNTQHPWPVVRQD